jgi:hypothetical protein
MAATGNSHDLELEAWLPRLLAIPLALGGCFWGFLLFPWVFRPEASLQGLAIFVPGYLVTLGYIVRSAFTLPLMVRRLIWGSSILVQGSWLAFMIGSIIVEISRGGHLPHKGGDMFIFAWWVFATTASVAGFFVDKPKAKLSNSVDQRGEQQHE